MSVRQYLEYVRVDMPLLIMVLLVIMSAVAVIYTKHMSRTEFAET